jgi:hypothetical protein
MGFMMLISTNKTPNKIYVPVCGETVPDSGDWVLKAFVTCKPVSATGFLLSVPGI